MSNIEQRFQNCDSIVQSVVEKFISRAEFGRKKYGQTLDRQDLTTDEWINHAIEEAMDMILYMAKLKVELSEKIEENEHMRTIMDQQNYK